MRKSRFKRYLGVSMVEMLITIFIVSIVMLVASTTITTLLKTSLMTSARTTMRQESEFMLELLRRNVKNSLPQDIRMYNVQGRRFDITTRRTQDTNLSGYTSVVGVSQSATEIHFRPLGYSKWVCIGYFPSSSDDTKGYILKSYRDSMENPSSCFASNDSQSIANTIILNSSDVDINSVSMKYNLLADGNVIYTMDMEVEPTKWIPGRDNNPPKFFKQIVTSTQKLTWE